jgi:hypothetical protein
MMNMCRWGVGDSQVGETDSKEVRMTIRCMAAAGWLLLAGLGCATPGVEEPAAPPKESYVQPPVRNMVLKTDIAWEFAYQPADPNGAGVWAREIAPNRLRAALSEEGKSDGNSFVPGTSAVSQVILRVYEYTDGNTPTPRNSLRAEAWALGHKAMAFSVSTASSSSQDEMVRDLARRLYTWFHGGWHTN